MLFGVRQGNEDILISDMIPDRFTQPDSGLAFLIVDDFHRFPFDSISS